MNQADRQSARPITLRLTVLAPPAGVRWAVQLGRDELSAPETVARDRIVFRIGMELVRSSKGELRLRGPAVQGPAGAKFVYVTSGTRAGDAGSRWNRRAKVPLNSVPLAQLHTLTSIELPELLGEIQGTGKDGGPACASVPILGAGWVLATRTG